MDRIAPDGGYSGGVKAQYRRNVWASFRDAAKRQGWLRSECNVLLMPSAEGKEIEVAEASGFRRQNMHVVDRNPAIVAHLSRRYPGINTYGCAVSKAFVRVAAAGVRLRFLNLDFCGSASATYQRELVSVAMSRCLAPVSYVAVTMLRGREPRAFRQYMDATMFDLNVLRERWRVCSSLSDTDLERVAFIGPSLVYRGDDSPFGACCPIRIEQYKSTAGHQTMLWSLWQVVEPPQAHWTFNPHLDVELRQLQERVGGGSL